MAVEVFGIRRKIRSFVRRIVSDNEAGEPSGSPQAEALVVSDEADSVVIAEDFVYQDPLLDAGLVSISRPLSGDHTIDQIWNAHPGVAAIFAEHQLKNCLSCAVRFDERLSEACERYGISEGDLLERLNALFEEAE